MDTSHLMRIGWLLGTLIVSLQAFGDSVIQPPSSSESVDPVQSSQSTISIEVNGSGRVTPNYDQQSLTLGAVYKMTAIPAKGLIFTGWTGSVQSNASKLSFTMGEGFAITVNFLPNPFPELRGTYSGNISLREPFGSSRSRKSLRIHVQRNGAFAGRIEMPNGIELRSRQYHFSGRFAADGSAHVTVSKKGLPPFDVTLQLDLNNGNGIQAELSGFMLVGDAVVQRNSK
jgi:hypothetical protein